MGSLFHKPPIDLNLNNNSSCPCASQCCDSDNIKCYCCLIIRNNEKQYPSSS